MTIYVSLTLKSRD